jgi:hypothetical protein
VSGALEGQGAARSTAAPACCVTSGVWSRFGGAMAMREPQRAAVRQRAAGGAASGSAETLPLGVVVRLREGGRCAAVS